MSEKVKIHKFEIPKPGVLEFEKMISHLYSDVVKSDAFQALRMYAITYNLHPLVDILDKFLFENFKQGEKVINLEGEKENDK